MVGSIMEQGIGTGYDRTGVYGDPGSMASGRDGIAAGEDKAADKTGRLSSQEECQTCKNRKYQDGSDENVSFKSAAHISPEAAGARVAAHEAEHVANAYTKAAEKDGKVINASVSLQTAICPECGRVYVAGGETRTMIKYPNEENPYQQERKSQDAVRISGAKVNYKA